MENDLPKSSQFITYIEKNDTTKLRALTEKYHARDIVINVINKLTIEQIVNFFRMIKIDDSAKIFSYLGAKKSEEIIIKLKKNEIKEIFDELETSEIIDLLDELPPNIIHKIFEAISKEKRKEINLLLKYEDSMVGHHMSIDFVLLSKQMTIKLAIKEIKKYREKKTVERLPFTFFVCDKENNLTGYIDYEELLFEKSTTLLEKIVKPAPFVNTRDDIALAIEKFKDYKLETLVVINAQNKIVGILDSDAILDAVEDEYIEDIDKISGINESERNYLTKPIKSVIKSRAGWLVSLLFVATITQLAIELFLSVIWGIDTGSDTLTGAQLTAVTTAIAVMPLLIDSAGNAGGQSTGTIIRSLATKEISTKDWRRVMKKELTIALAIGVLMFVGNFTRMVFVDLIKYQGYTAIPDGTAIVDIMVINLITSLALFVAMIIAKLVGSMAPLLARKLNWDEASVSSPMITTILDILVVFVYFGMISLAFFVM